MSNFRCEKCHLALIDTPHGYITGCACRPADNGAVLHYFKRAEALAEALEAYIQSIDSANVEDAFEKWAALEQALKAWRE